MKEKTRLIISVCAIICITLLLGEYIYLEYNKPIEKVSNKNDKETVKVAISNDDKKDYFEEKTKVNDIETINNSDDVVSYIDTVVDTAIEENETEKNESKLKNTFITLTDFIFYDGTIKGYTFKELREEQKQKIILAWEKLDAKIESKYPDYKEKLKEKKDKAYTNLKDKMASLKESISEKVGEDAVEEAKTDTENLKDVTSYYKDKTSEYYNKAKGKISDWYSNYKNKDE